MTLPTVGPAAMPATSSATGADAGVMIMQATRALFSNGVTEASCMAHASRKFFDLHARTRV